MSLPPSLAVHAAAQGGAFTTAQALSAGYDEREISALLKTRRWTRLRRGVFAESTLISDDDAKVARLALQALQLRTSRQFAASHETAALLHELTLLRPDLDLIHVTRSSRGGGRIEAGVHWHSGALPQDHVTQSGDLCCTTVARTVVDIARESDFRDGLVVAESALNRKLTTPDELRQVHEFCSDWPGARTAGRVVSFASPLSESPGETMSRIAFADQGLPDPEQQRHIYDALGFIGRVDFLWLKHHTIGEFDGKVKYVGTGGNGLAVVYDEKRREDRLRDAGFQVVRFGWYDVVKRPAWVAKKIRTAFARAAREHG